ncbi:vrrB protein, partial [Bacillus cereus]|nr:vrrB protein [Bacillus cereus]
MQTGFPLPGIGVVAGGIGGYPQVVHGQHGHHHQQGQQRHHPHTDPHVSDEHKKRQGH